MGPTGNPKAVIALSMSATSPPSSSSHAASFM